MLASDSDSDFEYTSAPGPGNSEEASSEEDGLLLGKLALGVDSQDMKSYDGRSTPINGSQYLMKVMAEKKVVPKVVSVDTDKLVGKKMRREEKEILGGGTPHYLDKFLQVCDGGAGDMRSFLPSDKWREETVSCFSLMRSRIEKWQFKVEAKEIWIRDRVEFPQSNDNTHWLKFCFGDGFVKLLAGSKLKSKEHKLADFFLDIYDPEVNAMVFDRVPATDKNLETESQTAEDETNGTNSLERNEIVEESQEKTNPQLGLRPLMSLVLQLNHQQLEKLVKWNLLWVQNFGFVNECQGQWLYAVLTCLIKPVDPSIMSDLRSIVRVLIKIRNKFSEEWGDHFEEVKYTSDRLLCDDERVFDFINTLNLFIYLIALYFQQGDLVMKV